jgi:hypothetical protein
MSIRLSLEQKTEIAWFKKTGKKGGWKEYLRVHGTMSQEELARHFGVAYMTSHRWHNDPYHKKEVHEQL